MIMALLCQDEVSQHPAFTGGKITESDTEPVFQWRVTEHQEYRVVSKDGPIELRAYPACTVADVQVAGSLEQAGMQGFRPLVTYISAAKLAMTAPVLTTPAGPGQWVVSFVLPGGESPDRYPLPMDSTVVLREVPAHHAAAITWSGRWTERNVSVKTAELVAEVARQGWRTVGEPYWARFDPPWQPAFLRRNEVLVDVQLDGHTP